jgi:hypothetical protein
MMGFRLAPHDPREENCPSSFVVAARPSAHACCRGAAATVVMCTAGRAIRHAMVPKPACWRSWPRDFRKPSPARGAESRNWHGSGLWRRESVTLVDWLTWTTGRPGSVFQRHASVTGWLAGWGWMWIGARWTNRSRHHGDDDLCRKGWQRMDGPPALPSFGYDLHVSCLAIAPRLGRAGWRGKKG